MMNEIKIQFLVSFLIKKSIFSDRNCVTKYYFYQIKYFTKY